jgi:hypothetical protein
MASHAKLLLVLLFSLSFILPADLPAQKPDSDDKKEEERPSPRRKRDRDRPRDPEGQKAPDPDEKEKARQSIVAQRERRALELRREANGFRKMAAREETPSRAFSKLATILETIVTQSERSLLAYQKGDIQSYTEAQAIIEDCYQNFEKLKSEIPIVKGNKPGQDRDAGTIQYALKKLQSLTLLEIETSREEDFNKSPDVSIRSKEQLEKWLKSSHN